MAQRIQTVILQDLRQTLGVDATLPEAAAKDLMLQVLTVIFKFARSYNAFPSKNENHNLSSYRIHVFV